MRLKKNFWPKVPQDWAVTTFLWIIIPIVYWFELFVVLPVFYSIMSFWYCFHFILGTFILFNVVTNFMAIILIDTSIQGLILPTDMLGNWRFCSVCECIAPPRSWHCPICNTCILKRDHHCIFSGCCVGHNNSRYFIIFLIYMFIATIYATPYNICFIYNMIDISSIKSVICLIFPLAMVFVEFTWNQFFMFLVLIIIVGSAFTGFLSYYHIHILCKGYITPEKKMKVKIYDLGLMDNIKVVFGERWYLTWLAPFVESQVKHDGINWKEIETQKDK
ncbi:PREDICTED: probable palmitoyltransferase ZDHHC24 [Nicrophorus vespilloides]|uniref:Palmitoyltransferase n=1 Tax=Nicrophorus vespilloides TaxID=110193 RepID=A0ABM1MFS9_NICVS|nr:PREDICTED: probable palmitoyltransferase ZDHHC24 [Nicrophorus vespilloides]